MDAGSFLIGAATAGIAAAGLFLAYRERTKSLRDRLYEEKLRGLLELYTALERHDWELVNGQVMAAVARMERATNEEADTVWEATKKTSHELMEVERRWALILPEKIIRRLRAYQRADLRIRGWGVPRGSLALLGVSSDPDASKEARDEARQAYESLIAAMREELGVERLSDEALRLFGHSPSASKTHSAKGEG